jgi:hypothetical protein
VGITIDEEFQSLIPPLSDFERLQLGETLEKEGCRDPLITWNGILIDGHNRHEICERLGLEYSTCEITLADRDSVKAWMYRNQLGRRNLSPADASELRGLIYNARKKTKSQAGSKGGASKAQNDTCLKSTADEVAAETGVSAATIKRDAEYADAVDEVAKTDPAIRSKVRKGDVKKKDVIATAKAKASPEKPGAAKPANPPKAATATVTTTKSSRPPRHLGEHRDSETFALGTADVAIAQLKGIPMENKFRDAAIDRVLSWIGSQRTQKRKKPTTSVNQ